MQKVGYESLDKLLCPLSLQDRSAPSARPGAWGGGCPVRLGGGRDLAGKLSGFRARGTHAAGKEGEWERASLFRQKDDIAIGIELDG